MPTSASAECTALRAKHHAQRAEQRERAEDPEDDGLAGGHDVRRLRQRRLGEEIDSHLTCSPTGSFAAPLRASTGPCT